MAVGLVWVSVLPQKCHLGGNSIGQSNQWPIDQEPARRQWGLPPATCSSLGAHSANWFFNVRADRFVCNADALSQRKRVRVRENIGLELRFVLFEPINYSLKTNLALAALAVCFFTKCERPSLLIALGVVCSGGRCICCVVYVCVRSHSRVSRNKWEPRARLVFLNATRSNKWTRNKMANAAAIDHVPADWESLPLWRPVNKSTLSVS